MGQNPSKRRSYTPGQGKSSEIPTSPRSNGDIKVNGSIETHHGLEVKGHDDDDTTVPMSPTSMTSASSSSSTGKKEKRKKLRFIGFSLKRTPSGKWSRKRRNKSTPNGTARPVSCPNPIGEETEAAAAARPQSMFFEELELVEEDAKLETVDLSDPDEEGKTKSKMGGKPAPKVPEKNKGKRGSLKKSGSGKKKKEKQNSKKDKQKKSKKSPTNLIPAVVVTDEKDVEAAQVSVPLESPKLTTPESSSPHLPESSTSATAQVTTQDSESSVVAQVETPVTVTSVEGHVSEEVSPGVLPKNLEAVASSIVSESVNIAQKRLMKEYNDDDSQAASNPEQKVDANVSSSENVLSSVTGMVSTAVNDKLDEDNGAIIKEQAEQVLQRAQAEDEQQQNLQNQQKPDAPAKVEEEALVDQVMRAVNAKINESTPGTVLGNDAKEEVAQKPVVANKEEAIEEKIVATKAKLRVFSMFNKAAQEKDQDVDVKTSSSTSDPMFRVTESGPTTADASICAAEGEISTTNTTESISGTILAAADSILNPSKPLLDSAPNGLNDSVPTTDVTVNDTMTLEDASVNETMTTADISVNHTVPTADSIVNNSVTTATDTVPSADSIVSDAMTSADINVNETDTSVNSPDSSINRAADEAIAVAEKAEEEIRSLVASSGSLCEKTIPDDMIPDKNIGLTVNEKLTSLGEGLVDESLQETRTTIGVLDTPLKGTGHEAEITETKTAIKNDITDERDETIRIAAVDVGGLEDEITGQEPEIKAHRAHPQKRRTISENERALKAEKDKERKEKERLEKEQLRKKKEEEKAKEKERMREEKRKKMELKAAEKAEKEKMKADKKTKVPRKLSSWFSKKEKVAISSEASPQNENGDTSIDTSMDTSIDTTLDASMDTTLDSVCANPPQSPDTEVVEEPRVEGVVPSPTLQDMPTCAQMNAAEAQVINSLSIDVSVEPLAPPPLDGEPSCTEDIAASPTYPEDDDLPSPGSDSSEPVSPGADDKYGGSSGLLKKINLGPRLRTAILRKKSSGASDSGGDDMKVSLTQPKSVECSELTPPPRKLRPRKAVEQYSPILQGAHNLSPPANTSAQDTTATTPAPLVAVEAQSNNDSQPELLQTGVPHVSEENSTSLQSSVKDLAGTVGIPGVADKADVVEEIICVAQSVNESCAPPVEFSSNEGSESAKDVSHSSITEGANSDLHSPNLVLVTGKISPTKDDDEDNENNGYISPLVSPTLVSTASIVLRSTSTDDSTIQAQSLPAETSEVNEDVPKHTQDASEVIADVYNFGSSELESVLASSAVPVSSAIPILSTDNEEGNDNSTEDISVDASSEDVTTQSAEHDDQTMDQSNYTIVCMAQTTLAEHADISQAALTSLSDKDNKHFQVDDAAGETSLIPSDISESLVSIEQRESPGEISGLQPSEDKLSDLEAIVNKSIDIEVMDQELAVDKLMDDKPVDDEPDDNTFICDKSVDDEPDDNTLIYDKSVDDVPDDNKLIYDKPVNDNPMDENPVDGKVSYDTPIVRTVAEYPIGVSALDQAVHENHADSNQISADVHPCDVPNATVTPVLVVNLADSLDDEKTPTTEQHNDSNNDNSNDNNNNSSNSNDDTSEEELKNGKEGIKTDDDETSDTLEDDISSSPAIAVDAKQELLPGIEVSVETPRPEDAVSNHVDAAGDGDGLDIDGKALEDAVTNEPVSGVDGDSISIPVVVVDCSSSSTKHQDNNNDDAVNRSPDSIGDSGKTSPNATIEAYLKLQYADISADKVTNGSCEHAVVTGGQDLNQNNSTPPGNSNSCPPIQEQTTG